MNDTLQNMKIFRRLSTITKIILICVAAIIFLSSFKIYRMSNQYFGPEPYRNEPYFGNPLNRLSRGHLFFTKIVNTEIPMQLCNPIRSETIVDGKTLSTESDSPENRTYIQKDCRNEISHICDSDWILSRTRIYKKGLVPEFQLETYTCTKKALFLRNDKRSQAKPRETKPKTAAKSVSEKEDFLREPSPQRPEENMIEIK